MSVFGGLRGELRYDDVSFEGIDPDIREMFYGDDNACLTARWRSGCSMTARASACVPGS